MIPDEATEFTVLGRRSDLPFRPRSLSEGYAVFEADEGTVLVHPFVRAYVTGTAARADLRETGGLLVGRFVRDDEGPYTIVVGAVTAPANVGTVGTFKLTPEMTTQLRDQAGRLYPGLDVIGWWHTHLAPSGYSSTDRDNQTMWTDPRHVGLLVFAQRSNDDAWARVYLGPTSVPTKMLQDVPPMPLGVKAEAVQPSGPDARSRRNGVVLLRRSGDGSLERFVRVLAFLLLVSAAVGLVLLLALAFSGRGAFFESPHDRGFLGTYWPSPD